MAISYTSVFVHPVSGAYDRAPVQVRPVVLVPGFNGSPLYDAENGFKLEYLDPEDLVSADSSATDLHLPLEWSTQLTQSNSSVGPERFEGDAIPDIEGEDGLSLTDVSYSQLRDVVKALANSSSNPYPGTPLFYSLAWDWRRDLFDESSRLLALLKHVKTETGVAPIVVGHSYGGSLTYMTIARYGKEAADLMGGVLYAAVPFSVSSILVGGLTTGFTQGINTELQGPEALFTYPSSYLFAPSLANTCVNAPTPANPAPRICTEGEVLTGISCDGPNCGRPADWPAGEPFFLPLDMHSAELWQLLGLGLPTARLLKDESPLLSPQELFHLQGVLNTSARWSDFIFGEGGKTIWSLHPPTSVITLSLDPLNITNVDNITSTVNFDQPTFIECVATPAFGVNFTQPQCSDIVAAGNATSDGFVPLDLQLPVDVGGQENVQIFEYNEPSPSWVAAASTIEDFPFTPHVTALQIRNSFEGQPLDCSWRDPNLLETDQPSLEEHLCSLMYRADAHLVYAGTNAGYW